MLGKANITVLFLAAADPTGENTERQCMAFLSPPVSVLNDAGGNFDDPLSGSLDEGVAPHPWSMLSASFSIPRGGDGLGSRTSGCTSGTAG